MVAGVRYFQTEDKRGVFIRPAKLEIDELENELSDEKEIRIEAENKLEELEFKLAENEAGSGRKTPKVKRSAEFRRNDHRKN